MLTKIKEFIENGWRNKKVFFIFGLAAVVLIVGGVVFFALNGDDGAFDDAFVIGETKEVIDAVDYLVQGETGEYLLLRTNADMKFQVTTVEDEVRFSIADEDGNEVPARAIRIEDTGDTENTGATDGAGDIGDTGTIGGSGNNFEIVADENYRAGESYTIVLENAMFADERLTAAHMLDFTTVRENADTRVLHGGVRRVNREIIVSIEENADDFVLTSTGEFQQGDILYYEDGIDIRAFKVDTVARAGESFIINTVTPSLDEVFEELDIYGEFPLRITDFATDEELEAYIIAALTRDGILDAVIPSAYAAGKPIGFSVAEQRDGSVAITVKLQLAGQEDALLSARMMKDYAVTLNLKITIKLTAHCDITLRKQDFGTHMEISVVECGIAVEPSAAVWGQFAALLNKDDEANVAEAKRLLIEIEKGEQKANIVIGKVKIPTPIAGLTVDLGIDFLNEMKLALDADASAGTTISIRFGYKNKNGFYWNSNVRSTGTKFEAVGSVVLKTGIRPKAEITYIAVLKAGIEAPMGAYLEGQVNYVTKDNQVDGKMDLGWFLDVNIYGRIALGKMEFAKISRNIYDKKLSVMTIEGSLSGNDNDTLKELWAMLELEDGNWYVSEDPLSVDLLDTSWYWSERSPFDFLAFSYFDGIATMGESTMGSGFFGDYYAEDAVLVRDSVYRVTMSGSHYFDEEGEYWGDPFSIDIDLTNYSRGEIIVDGTVFYKGDSFVVVQEALFYSW